MRESNGRFYTSRLIFANSLASMKLLQRLRSALATSNVYSRDGRVSVPPGFWDISHLPTRRLSWMKPRASLEASCAVGLSGPSRLHDLFVTYDAITPGQYKAMGSGLEIRYGVHTGLFGDYLAASTDRGLCALRFLGDGGKEAAVAELRHEFPGARLLREEDETIELCARHLAAKPLTGPGQLRLFCKGTNFQIRVWAALLSMPTGALATYGDIARAVGAPKAARAVGSAVAANPVAALIPCHRVIRATRLFQTDYRWGSARKLAMIGWEQAQRSKSCDFDL